jgi:hypothetical protein
MEGPLSIKRENDPFVRFISRSKSWIFGVLKNIKIITT